jgi:hypothetical protein
MLIPLGGVLEDILGAEEISLFSGLMIFFNRMLDSKLWV